MSLGSASRKASRGSSDDARLLPRHRASETPSLERRRLERAQAAVVIDALATNTSDALPLRHELTKPGDADQLRGIPAIGRSVTGAIPGSTPGSPQSLNRLDRQRQLDAA